MTLQPVAGGSISYFYITRGAFGVARFDNQGNAKAFMAWNGQQSGSTLDAILQWITANKEQISPSFGKFDLLPQFGIRIDG